MMIIVELEDNYGGGDSVMPGFPTLTNNESWHISDITDLVQ